MIKRFSIILLIAVMFGVLGCDKANDDASSELSVYATWLYSNGSNSLTFTFSSDGIYTESENLGGTIADTWGTFYLTTDTIILAPQDGALLDPSPYILTDTQLEFTDEGIIFVKQ